MNALASLVLAAGLTAPPAAPPAPGRSAESVPAPVVEIARVRRADAAAAQRTGFVPVRFGAEELSLSAAFDASGESWLVLSAGGETRALALAAAGAGTDVALGGVSARVTARGDTLTLAGAGAAAELRYTDLLAALFGAARHVRVHEALDYAVLVEDGARGVPASVCLVRRDSEGTYWVTYRRPEDLRAPTWFVAVNGVLKGLVGDGPDVVFLEKKLP